MVLRAHQQQYRRIEPDVGVLSCASASRGADRGAAQVRWRPAMWPSCNTVQPLAWLYMLHAGGAGMDRFEGGPMRWFLVLSCAFVLSSESAAQAPSRWTLSAGPEWTPTPSNSRFYGGRAGRGEGRGGGEGGSSGG